MLGVVEIGALGWDQDRGGRLCMYGIKTEEGIRICTLRYVRRVEIIGGIS